MPPSRPESPTYIVDSIDTYKNGVGEIDLLTAEEEVFLAQTIESGRHAAQQLLVRSRELSEPEREELQIKNQLGVEAKNKFIEANLRLVLAIAGRYIKGKEGLDYSDLVQEGNIALIRAVEKFDYRRGFKFSTYATWWIRQAMQRGIADMGKSIRIPVHMTETLNQVIGARYRLERRCGRRPTPEEIATEAGVTETDVQQALYIEDVVSIHQQVGEDHAELGDFIEDADAIDPQDAALEKIESEEFSRFLRAAVEDLGLSKDDLYVLSERYGYGDGHPKIFRDIAIKLNMSSSKVSEIEKKAIEKIREYAQTHPYSSEERGLA